MSKIFFSLSFFIFFLQISYAQNENNNEKSYLEKTYTTNMPFDNDWFSNEVEASHKIECSAKYCVDLTQTIKKALEHNFATKRNYFDLANSFLNTISNLSNILPSIQLSLGNGTFPVNAWGALSNLVGFLIPSNWFNWGESLYLYRAQGYLYINLLEEVVYMVEVLYYTLHRTIYDYYIYYFYYSNLLAIKNNVESNPEKYQLSEDNLLFLTNYLNTLKIDLIQLKQGLESEFGNFFHQLAVKGDWHDIGIKMYNNNDIGQKEKVDFDYYHNLSINSSMLLQAFDNLIRAAHFARFSRIFSFFSLKTDGTVGISLSLSYFSDIILSSSNVEKLRFEKEESKSQIKQFVWESVNNFNNAIDIYNVAEEGKVENRKWLELIINRYQNDNNLDVGNLTKAISYALKFEMLKNRAFHLYMISKIEFEMNIGNTGKYNEIYKYVPSRQPPTAKGNYHRWMEDREIKKYLDSLNSSEA